MLNRYPIWVYPAILTLLAVSVLFTLPNFYGRDAAVQVAYAKEARLKGDLKAEVEKVLAAKEIQPKSIEMIGSKVLLRFDGKQAQTIAQTQLEDSLNISNYRVAATFAHRTPAWLQALGASPMGLGEDLQGGVKLVLEVDIDQVNATNLERAAASVELLIAKAAKDDRNYSGIRVREDKEKFTVQYRARNDQIIEQLRAEAEEQMPYLFWRKNESRSRVYDVFIKEEEAQRRARAAIEKNVLILKSRIDRLGVAEPAIQRQGENRIQVRLPGLSDAVEAKRRLQSSASLEIRGGCDAGTEGAAAIAALQNEARVPPGCKLFRRADGAPVLLKRSVIATGQNVISATAGRTQENRPAVFVELDTPGGTRMAAYTSDHLKKPMATVFVDNKLQKRVVNGETVLVPKREEYVLQVANIQSAFSSSYMITGMTEGRGRAVVQKLKEGGLAAPFYFVGENTIDPSLGAENIDRGVQAIILGFILVIIFMALYYRVFGLFANMALIVNVLLMTAFLSAFGAVLTLPGIAGVVLTVGMAVDANVLIFERIREELRNGENVQKALHNGYDRAFSTILDANVTTLIAAAILFAAGSGPIKGFAVTLIAGILTSMFTAIVGTRALANLVYGGRRDAKLHI